MNDRNQDKSKDRGERTPRKEIYEDKCATQDVQPVADTHPPLTEEPGEDKE